MSSYKVSLLDYGAGNVRSLRNAIRTLGFEVEDICTAEEIMAAKVILFPGVGSYGQAMNSIQEKGWSEALKAYIKADRPFFGICLGMQSLFEGSEETPGIPGLGIIPGMITKFDTLSGLKVPQIGWNGFSKVKSASFIADIKSDDNVYFVHSFCALPTEANLDWVLGVTDYGDTRYISAIQKGNVFATQFHPEKSGAVGLKIIKSFLDLAGAVYDPDAVAPVNVESLRQFPSTTLVRRVIACLDVRSNDHGDLVVTKGDQYDVREASTSDSNSGRGDVRNLGKPVGLCETYYADGADEVVFLNITSFRNGVIEDLPMLQVLEKSSEKCFVPLTVGGGIREYVDPVGNKWSALDVAARYFRAGADKVSIGGDAVYSVEEYLSSNMKTGKSSIEQISNHYGAQAVVVSIDPKRVYVSSPSDAPSGMTVVQLREGDKGGFGPNGECYCWWQATVKGGRETRNVDAITVAKISELLGAGEIMLNCIDFDGQGNGYDEALITAVSNSITIPVIASSGAGAVEHFSDIFKSTNVSAALAAGIFHRKEVPIQSVKQHLVDSSIPCRK